MGWAVTMRHHEPLSELRVGLGTVVRKVGADTHRGAKAQLALARLERKHRAADLRPEAVKRGIPADGATLRLGGLDNGVERAGAIRELRYKFGVTERLVATHVAKEARRVYQ